MNQFEYTTKEFAAEVARRAGRPCSWRTVQNWRIAHDGHAARLLPTRYERKGRIAIYTEEQILVAVALLGAKYSSDESNLFAYTTKDTVPVDATIEADGSEGDSGSDDTNAVEIDSPVDLVNTESITPTADDESITPTADDESTAAATSHKGINLHDYGWDDVEAAIGENYTEDAELADARKKADTVPADVQPVRADNKQARIDEATKIFNLLYGKIPAGQFSYLIKFSGGTQCYSFEIGDENQRHEMARKAVELSDSGVDIWHAVNPVCVKPHYEFDEKKQKNVLKRGDDDVVSYQIAVVVDIDIRSDAHKGNPADFAADFNEAKSFLPFPPSILINSGYGLHAYYIWAEPLAITDDNREEIKRRNNLLLEVIRAKAAGKKVDGVGDLPRILRTPGTFNYKLGRGNAPLCHVVEVNDIRFTPADFNERLNALTPQLTGLFEPARADDGQSSVAKKSDVTLDDSPELKAFRIRHMLRYINVIDGEYEKWLDVGFALFNEDMQLSDWEQWSRTQPEFKDGECESKWAGFSYRSDGITIGTLYQWAVAGGYDEKEVQREWYQLHPELSKGGRKAYQSKMSNDSDAAQIEQLNAELRDAKKALADFDAQKTAALERLRNVEVFDSATVFSDDILDAAAFAYRDDEATFSDFRRDVKNYGDKHKDVKADIMRWLAAVKKHDALLCRRHKDLLTRRNEIQAQIDALTFAADNDALAGLTFPVGYSVNPRYGILKAAGEDMITVCRRPVVIKGITYSVDEKIFKVNLSYQSKTGKWKNLPAQENFTVSEKSKIVALSNVGLPVTSSNAKLLVDYLEAFKAENETALPLTYSVPRGGWYTFNGSEYFVHPRRDIAFTNDEGKQVSVEVDTSRSQFANALTTAGTIEEWKRAYLLAKPSPIARLVVAAAVAPPLLKILGERNFFVYVQAPTRAGKSTVLLLAASAVGSEKIVRSFDATKNGLAGAAAEVSDFPFMIDEKQAADGKLKEQFTDVVYLLANGVSRTKLHRTSKLMDLSNWQIVILANGETQFLDDTVTDGAKTRLLTVAQPETILDADTCKLIRDIIKENYGLIFPRVVDEILKYGSDTLRGIYAEIVAAFAKQKPKILPEHRRYLAVITLADMLLNSVLGINNVTLADGRTIKAIDDATINAEKIFALIPTMDELSAARKSRDFVISFIAQNQNRFIGGNVVDAKIQQFYGKLRDADGYTYIMAKTLRDACKADGWDYRKLVADLVAEGFFVPRDKLKKNRHTPTPTVPKNISEIKNAECYRIPNEIFDAVD